MLRVPNIATNLLSVHKLCKDNYCHFIFHDNHFLVQENSSGRVLYQGPSNKGLYPIHGFPSPSINDLHPCLSSSITANIGNKVSSHLWHSRLGHPSNQILHQILTPTQTGFADHPQNHTTCQHCLHGKMAKLPFSASTSSSKHPSEIVYSDVWGAAPIKSMCANYTSLFMV